jgi:5-deoxy-glucuronate isomerase
MMETVEGDHMTVMSGITVQAAPSPDKNGMVVRLTRREACWEYVSFAVWRLTAGQRVEDNTGDEEVGLVILSGKVTVRSSSGNWDEIGERQNVFEGKPYVVYLPPQTSFALTAVTDCDVARAGAMAEHGMEARLITPAQITEDLRGEGNAQRRVRHVLEADQPAEHLFLVEVLTPSGNWSSYPPHKHDTNNPPHETYLEEIYYHRVRPPQGFGFQRVYTDDGRLDEAVVIEDGMVVMVPKGYHPAVVAPGYELYYLNVMAGPIREWRFVDDVHHRWVSEGWKPYGSQETDSAAVSPE